MKSKLTQPMSLDDVIEIPAKISNSATIDETHYTAVVSEIEFVGSLLVGKVYFSKMRGDEPQCEFWTLKERKELLVEYGNSPSGMSGYRAAIIGGFANKGHLISNRALASVFAPLDQKLLEIYDSVFPKEDIVSFEGYVSEVIGKDESMTWRHQETELYVLLGEDTVCRVGIEKRPTEPKPNKD